MLHWTVSSSSCVYTSISCHSSLDDNKLMGIRRCPCQLSVIIHRCGEVINRLSDAAMPNTQSMAISTIDQSDISNIPILRPLPHISEAMPHTHTVNDHLDNRPIRHQQYSNITLCPTSQRRCHIHTQTDNDHPNNGPIRQQQYYPLPLISIITISSICLHSTPHNRQHNYLVIDIPRAFLLHLDIILLRDSVALAEITGVFRLTIAAATMELASVRAPVGVFDGFRLRAFSTVACRFDE